MKRFSVLVFLTLMMLGCGGAPPAPPWLSTAVSRLDQFKSEYLGGRMDLAEMNFELALAEIKKSGDLELLGRAYLTRTALDVALLKPFRSDEFQTVNRIAPSERNETYYHLLQGKYAEVNPKMIPEAYVRFVSSLVKGEGKIAAAIGEIKDPLSRLIACGIYTTSRGEDEEVLKIGVDTASQRGWKRALTVYLERLAVYYERAGRGEEAKKVRSRLAIIGS